MNKIIKWTASRTCEVLIGILKMIYFLDTLSLCVCDILVSLQQMQVLFRVKEISILFPRVDIQSGSIHIVNPNKDYVLCIKASKCQKQ